MLGTAAAVTLLATVAVNLMTPIYQASATLLIENSKRSVVPLEEIYGVPAGSREFFQTQAEFMRSREVGIRVIKALGLENNPLFNPELDAEQKDENAGGEDGADKPKELSQEALEEQVLIRYKAGLDISPIKNSQLVEIRFDVTRSGAGCKSPTRRPSPTSRPIWTPVSTCSRRPAAG